ncbi:MAG: hypothetical protein ACRDEA_00305 [Microcystaceae cyanobacterium]
MINGKRHKSIAQVIASFLIIGALSVSLPVFAGKVTIIHETPTSGEPLQNSTGTVEDLEGIGVTSDWSWESGGKSEVVVDDSEEDSVSNQIVTPLSIQQQNEEWQKTNQGDDRPFSAGIPLADF